jgi:methionine-rich copper-binding protein CopC
MSKRVLIAALAALSALLPVPLAEAHPKLKSTVPGANTSTTPPQAIRLIFSEGLIPKLSGIELKDQSGKAIETGPAAADPKDTKQLVIPIKSPLAAGQYTVDWHAVSEDTHRVKGSFSFEVQP